MLWTNTTPARRAGVVFWDNALPKTERPKTDKTTLGAATARVHPSNAAEKPMSSVAGNKLFHLHLHLRLTSKSIHVGYDSGFFLANNMQEALIDT
jgi:hypothetical protein